MRERLGVSFDARVSVEEFVRLCKGADEAGCDSVWLPEHYGEGRDTVAMLMAGALRTSRVRLGTSVVNPFGRHPYLIANAFATLDEASGGRAVLGLGSGNPERLRRVLGVEQEKPMAALKEAVDAINGLLGDGADPLGFTPFRRKIPIMVAAVGPKMLRLAGQVGDGVIFSKVTPPEFIGAAMKHFQEGCRLSGRDPAGQDVVAMVACVVDEDHDRAVELAREEAIPILARSGRGEMLLSSFGADGSVLVEVRAALARGDRGGAARSVPEEVLRHLAVFGTAEECAQGLGAYRRAGVRLPVLFPRTEQARLVVESLSRGAWDGAGAPG